MRAARAAAVLAITAAQATAPVTARAVSSGIFGQVTEGCSCHSSTPGGSGTFTMVSVPLSAHGGDTVSIDITVISDIGEHPTGALGGFNLEVPAGALEATTAARTSADSRETTHRATGNRQRSWTVPWRLPETPPACELPVAAAALAADGSASNAGDAWDRGQAVLAIAFSGDDTPPQVEILTPPVGGVQVDRTIVELPLPVTVVAGEEVRIEIRLTDTGGIRTVTITDSGPGGDETLPAPAYDPASETFVLDWDTTRTLPGPHTLTVEATDCSGNDAALSMEVLVL